MERLSVAQGSLSFDAALEAFRPTSSMQARSSIIWQLSQTKEDVAQLFSPRLAKLFAVEEATSAKFFAGMRLLISLFATLPHAAHAIVFESRTISRILSKSAAAIDQTYLPSFIAAELLCAAANYTDSRRWILSDYTGIVKSTQKIVEIDKDSEQTSMHWLLSFAEKANLENASSGTLLCKVAMLASLALHKIQRGSKGKQADEQGDVVDRSKEADEGDEESSRRQEDTLLFELAKAHLVLDEGRGADLFADSTLPYVLESTTREELNRMCRLTSLESLTYLTLDSHFRDAVADSDQLLDQLCRYGKTYSGSDSGGTRTLFPQRGTLVTPSSSLYDVEKVLTSTDTIQWKGVDTALLYGLTTLLANITAYPPILSAEEKQLENLRLMANAKAKVKRADNGREEVDARMTTVAIEARIEKVIMAGGVEALAIIALSGAKDGRVNGSAAIRGMLSKALLSMTTRQDKLQRGKIIQQGGARALLTLCNQQIADVLQGMATQGRVSFDAMQGLAHLLITENPTLVLRDAAESIPCILYLYCHSASSRLQRFEAALALTNLASLGENMAKAIASCAFPRKALGSTEFAGAGSDEMSKAKVKTIDILEERIFLEENEMSRRSSLELLCNLLVENSIFQRWSGEEEDGEQDNAKRRDHTQGKTMKNLIFLIALCSPAGIDQATGEGGLKLRMAASGAVAILCSSPSTCERLLAAETRILNRLSRLVAVPLTESIADEEKTEAQLNEQDISEDPLGSEHATLQLALRGLTCLDYLLQYVGWLQSQGNKDVTIYKNKVSQAGAIEAIKHFALSMVKKMKQPHPNPSVQELQERVAQQSFDSLRLCKTLGLVLSAS